MVCFTPLIMYKRTNSALDAPAKDYYELKKNTFYPIKGREMIKIPCGKCLGCRLDHASHWATRIYMEAKTWKKNCFVTLTYNNPHLPITKDGLMTLQKKDLQDFLKRLRYYEKGYEEWEHPIKGEIERPIRYFACGEYGPKTGRPHYHMAIFNWEPDDLKFWKTNEHGDPIFTSKKLQKIWGNGFVVVEELNFNSASYIARYTLKKAGLSAKERQYTKEHWSSWEPDERTGNERTGDKQYWLKWHRVQKTVEKPVEEEFIVMSRGAGIGIKYYRENREKIVRNSGILVKVNDKVKIKPIPRYFRKLWEAENWAEYETWKYYQKIKGEENHKKQLMKLNLPPEYTDEDRENFYIELMKRNLLAKSGKFKRMDI